MKNGDHVLGLVGVLATAPYWPGVYAAATTPRWAGLFLTVPWLLQARDRKLAAPHYWGAAFLFIAAWSLMWLPDSLFDGIGQLFILALAASLFILGEDAKDLRPFYIGCALGMTVSSAVALVQLAGWHPVPQISPIPSGLFINGNYMAEAAAIVLVAVVSERLWWLVPGLLPALLLPGARGALLAATAGIAICYRKKTGVLAIAALIVFLVGLWSFIHFDANTERLMIWRSTLNGLSFGGFSLGSFWTTYPIFDLRANPVGLPEYAHNEWLNIAFELGIPGLICAIGLAVSLAGPLNTARLVLIALFVETCFAFPLHLPATLALGMVVAGHAVRDRYLLFDLALRGRNPVRPRLATRTGEPGFARQPDDGGADFPMGSSVPRWTSAADRN